MKLDIQVLASDMQKNMAGLNPHKNGMNSGVTER
jgi:hypothetical protein